MHHRRFADPLVQLQRTNLSIADTRFDGGQPATFACGDENGGAHYAWREDTGEGTRVPIMVEFEADPADVVVDGRDGLYTLIHLAGHPEVRFMLAMAWGEAVLPYLDAAAATELNNPGFEQRLAICDLACTDPDVVAAHHTNQKPILGRCETRYKSAFMLPAVVPPSSVNRVWVPERPPHWAAEDCISVGLMYGCFHGR